MKKYIITILLFWVSVYLVLSFIKLELDFQLWTQNERAVYVFILVFVTPLTVLLKKVIDSEL